MSPAPSPRSTRGFTLIELLMVVALIGILAAIAYAVYQNHVLKARRMTAVSCLLEYGQYRERYRAHFLEEPAYFSLSGKESGELPTSDDRLAPPICLKDLATEYRFTGTKGLITWPLQTGISVTATAIGTQKKDKCDRLEWSSLYEPDSVYCKQQSKVVEVHQ